METAATTLKQRKVKATKISVHDDINQPLRIRQEAFLEHLGLVFRYNIVRQVQQYSYDSITWYDIDERFEGMLQRKYELSESFKGREIPSPKRIQQLINTPEISEDYDPFYHFFTTNKWDGRDRFKELFATVKPVHHQFVGFTSATAWEQLFRRWLICSVKCMLGKGANHVMLVFMQTNQGGFKTTWLNNLYLQAVGKEHAGVTEKLDVSGQNKETFNYMAERGIFNIDDQLDGIFGKDWNAIKSFITKEFVTLRKAFARLDKSRPRRCNFVGSVNTTNLFRDYQNRRYLAFEIDSINWLAAKKIDMEQIWLQAYYYYAIKNEQSFFDKDDEKMLNQMADKFSEVSKEEEWFLRLYEPVEDFTTDKKYLTFSEILSNLKNASNLHLFERNLSNAFKKLQITSTQKRIQWKDTTQPREVYILRELFSRENSRIIPMELNVQHFKNTEN